MGMCPACPLAISASGIYSQKTTRDCSGSHSQGVQGGYQAITTAADCKAAATALGFSSSVVSSQSLSGRPSGCTSQSLGTVTFNRDDNNQQCTGKY
jgi:hypothetical protein